MLTPRSAPLEPLLLPMAIQEKRVQFTLSGFTHYQPCGCTVVPGYMVQELVLRSTAGTNHKPDLL